MDICSEVDVGFLDPGEAAERVAALGHCGAIAAGDVFCKAGSSVSSFVFLSSDISAVVSAFSVSGIGTWTFSTTTTSAFSAGIVPCSAISCLSSSSSCSGAGDNSERGDVASSVATGSSADAVIVVSAVSDVGCSVTSGTTGGGLVDSIGFGEPASDGGDNGELDRPLGEAGCGSSVGGCTTGGVAGPTSSPMEGNAVLTVVFVDTVSWRTGLSSWTRGDRGRSFS